MRIRASLFLVAALVILAATSARADGGWQTPDTLTGFVGSYTRPLLGGGPIAFVTFRGTDGYHADGPYTRFFDVGRGQLALQTGTYHAIGNNPAVGPFVFFLDDAGNFRDSFWIAGIKRDPLGLEIIAIELIDPRDGSLFSLVRVGL